MAFVRVEGRLDARMREALVSPDAAVHVSVASLWEIAIKFRLGKLPLKTLPARLTELLESLGLVLVAIKADHVLAAVDPNRRRAIRSTGCCSPDAPRRICVW